MIPFAIFVNKHRSLARDEFLDRIEVPHLYLDSPLKRFDESSRFRTERVADDVESAVAADSPAVVLPIRKRPGSNAFPMMITLGRAPNNDIIVPDKRISSFHCYLRQGTQSWVVCDASSNGTHLGGELLSKEHEAPLESGAVITLAKAVELTFLSAGDLYERVQRAAWD